MVVACAEPAIADAVRAAGGEAVLTDPALPSGTDRIFAALQSLDPTRRFERVVNLQGDLPTLDPAALRHVLEPLEALGTDMATLANPTDGRARRHRPERGQGGDRVRPRSPRARPGALLHARHGAQRPRPGLASYRHLRLHAAKRWSASPALPPSPLELRERLEQLRALEHGMSIGVRLVDVVPFGVDTPGDLEKARRILERRA